MINQNKWISTLPQINTKFNKETKQVDRYRWINTIPQKNAYGAVKKYSTLTILFVCGLLFVSAIKNETRNLENEINNLKVSNNEIKFNLDQAILDNVVITSPENISQLAKEYLNTNFVAYKKSQIKHLDDYTDTIAATTTSNKKNKNLSENVKLKIAKKIKVKKKELKKLQELYSKPEEIPAEIKIQVAKKIKEKKTAIKNLYSSPGETITLKKAQKWAAVQVVKVFLGMPIIPGK